MLLAYVDEVGESGAYVSYDHKRYNTSPAFGYAGFVIPAMHARSFGSIFIKQRNTLFKTELLEVEKPENWEKKGAEIFRPDTIEVRPQNWRVFAYLSNVVQKYGGHLFYYVDEKPIGTPNQTGVRNGDDLMKREMSAMRETLNRLARHAEHEDKRIMILMDQINEKARKQRLPQMYGHILGRASDFEEMRRIIEPPMHLDSTLSANIQFADWVAALVGRAINYQLVLDSKYQWAGSEKVGSKMKNMFTYESKLHFHERSLDDLNHSEIFSRNRILYPPVRGHLIGDDQHRKKLLKIKEAAEKAAKRKLRES